jgi:transaldolase/transaldolase/glucose-6-phosphate isomerase
MSRLRELAAPGRSVPSGCIRRSPITSGEFRSSIGERLRGITPDPTIFGKAVTGSRDRDDDIGRLSAAGKSVRGINGAMAFADIRGALDPLRSVYEETKGTDGDESLEADPTLACDTEGTVAEVREL